MTSVSNPSPSVKAVLVECLNYSPRFDEGKTPPVTFEDRLGDNFDGNAAREVDDSVHEIAAREIAEAYQWCATRFPLSIRSESKTRFERSICEISVGHSVHPDRLLSASSPDLPGVIFMAAGWPVNCHHRVGSLIAHESVHQALYVRESESTPVRRNSLGYSPWKKSVRPGRWVWHAYWTFACQLALLADSLLEDRSLQSRDIHLVRFIADMDARVAICLYSLELFDIVSDEELNRCTKTRSILDDLSVGLSCISGYDDARAAASNATRVEFTCWAEATLAR
jgi:hypothetical protein